MLPCHWYLMPLVNLFFSSLSGATHKGHGLVEWDVMCTFFFHEEYVKSLVPKASSLVSCCYWLCFWSSDCSCAPVVCGCSSPLTIGISHLTDMNSKIVFKQLLKFSTEKPRCDIVQHEIHNNRSWSGSSSTCQTLRNYWLSPIDTCSQCEEVIGSQPGQ